jgi:hypothetical protein
VDTAVWLTGIGVIVVGLIWHAVARRLATRRDAGA